MGVTAAPLRARGLDVVLKESRLVVATGGAGHAFNFAPVLCDIITATALGAPHPFEDKFRWRPDATPGVEAARYAGAT